MKSSFSCIYFQFSPNSVFQQILDWDTQNEQKRSESPNLKNNKNLY